MDRIIEVKVSGNHLSKDNKLAGVRGEANVTNLRITFDKGWAEYSKKITFWDALGKNPAKREFGKSPVERILTADILENIVESTEIYIVPIPGEAMTEAGELTFVIDGYFDGKQQRSVADKLVVKDAPIAYEAGEPIAPTPDQATQLQGQIDKLLGDIQAERKIVETASKAVGVALEITEANAKTTTADAELTGQHKEEARASAESAAESNAKAQETVGKTSYIGENGNWFAWDSVAGAFYDTRVRAQSGSIVYCGENPPEEADVWINPDEGTGGFYTAEETDALIAELRKTVIDLANKVAPSPAIITLYQDRWTQDGERNWHQEVEGLDVTENSMVDLRLTNEQFDEFSERGTSLQAVNDGGNITIHCKGALPEGEFIKLKVAISEVIVDGE